ncbi:MAG: aldehyde dehydrogenase family protein [Caldisphaera sp.]|nr:MAG: hypothetical protein C0171_07000 [Caldisphaera sp.]
MLNILDFVKNIDPTLVISDGSGLPIVYNGKPKEEGIKLKKENILYEPYYYYLPALNEIKKIKDEFKNKRERLRTINTFDRVESLIESSSTIERNEETLSKLISLETGKSIELSREEVKVSLKLLENIWTLISGDFDYARSGPLSLISEFDNTLLDIKSEGKLSLVIPSYTSPFYTTIASVSRALISGNPVIIKPSSYAMASTISAMAMFSATDLYDYIYYLPMRGYTALKEIDSEDLNIFLFGKEVTYNSLKRSLNGNIIPNCLGRAVVILCNEIDDIDLASNEIAKLALIHSGQACGSISWILSNHGLKDEIIENISDRFEQSSIGNPLDGKEVGPLKNKEIADRSTKLINDAISKGGKLITGGLTNDRYIEPTLINETPKNAEIMWSDIEAPVLAVTQVSNCNEAISLSAMMMGSSITIIYGNEKLLSSMAKAKRGIVIKGSNNLSSILTSLCSFVGNPIENFANKTYNGILPFTRSILIY